jgi:membrane protein required for colicin V production
MNWLDIILAIVLVITVIAGLKTGLIKAVFSLLGLVLGIFLAGRLYIPFSETLGFFPEQAAKVIAYLIILILVIVLAAIVATILDKILHAVMLGWINHIGGAIFGLAFGGILLGAILVIWAKYAGGGEIINHSTIGRFLLNTLPLVLGLLPSEFDTIRQFFK